MMQVIAIGGGGFSEGSEPGLDRYVLEHSRRASPRIGFLGTASGDSESYLLKFYARFAKLDCRPGHLPLFRRTPDLEAWIFAQDIIYVGGGNTKSMLAVWEGWKLGALLRRAGEAGTILAGISAGAICWFDFGVTDSASEGLAPMACLGILGGNCCPHYSGERDRRPSYEGLFGAKRFRRAMPSTMARPFTSWMATPSGWSLGGRRRTPITSRSSGRLREPVA